MMVIVNTIIGWLILLAMIIVLTNNNIPLIFPLINNLLGGFKHLFFSIIYGIILPIEYCMFQRGSNHQPGMVGCIFPDDFWDENMFFAGFSRVLRGFCFLGWRILNMWLLFFLFWLDGCFWVLCLFC